MSLEIHKELFNQQRQIDELVRIVKILISNNGVDTEQIEYSLDYIKQLKDGLI